MPVREALRILQRDGLVHINLHRGAEVARLSFQAAWEIEEVRLHLEAVACTAAAPLHDPASIATMRESVIALEMDLDHPVVTAQRNRDFHSLVMSRAPNAFLKAHINELWDRTWQHSSTSFFAVMPDRKLELVLENQTLTDIIEQRDSAALKTFLASRLERIRLAWARAIAPATRPDFRPSV